MLVPLESPSAVLVMIGSKSVSICNRLHARWASNGKIMISKGGTPLWCPRLRGISSPTGTKLPHRKLDTPDYHMVKTRSLYLTWAWYTTGSWQTDGRTDRIPIANTHLSSTCRYWLWRVIKLEDVWLAILSSRDRSQCRCERRSCWSIFRSLWTLPTEPNRRQYNK